MNGWAQLLVGVLAVVGGVLTTWLTVRRASKRDRIDTTQQFIDQLQEERAAADKRHTDELAAVRVEVAELRGRVLRMEDREMAFVNHIYELRDHIDQRKGPPPPRIPDSLMHRHRG